jgi:hypothetical protein
MHCEWSILNLALTTSVSGGGFLFCLSPMDDRVAPIE